MSNLFFGGSSDLAKKIASNFKNTDSVTSGKSCNYYRKNFKIKNYHKKNEIKKILKKIDTQYNNIVIFNGIYSSSFLTNFNKKEFLKVFNINYTIPIEIASILIQNKIVKKNGSIIFISSIAADEELIGNAYYSISKHALNFSSKILSNEQRLRGIRINTVSIGLVKNSMGLSAKNLSNTKKKFISINNIVKKFKILLNNSKINCKNIKIAQ